MSTRIAKPRPEMRKEPRQSRSRMTVEAIVQAGARILADGGWAGFTTNKVAEAAGVSIGSLYQYFPDKLSLVEAIRARHLDDCLAVMRRSERPGRTLEEFADDLVGDMFAAHDVNPGLHRVLLEKAPRFDTLDVAQSAFERAYIGYYTAAVATYRRRRAGAPDDIVALVLSDAIDGVIHNAVGRGMLGSAEIRRELARLVCFYLAAGER